MGVALNGYICSNLLCGSRKITKYSAFSFTLQLKPFLLLLLTKIFMSSSNVCVDHN